MTGMDSFLSCPGCAESFETKDPKQPMSLRCGHTYCSGNGVRYIVVWQRFGWCVTACLRKGCSKTDGKASLRCSTCRQLHTAAEGQDETSLWFPNHSMIQIIGNMLSKSKHVCSIHNHDKNYYCFDDCMLVCIYCAYHGQHSSHVCKHVDEAKKEAEASLKKLKLSLSGHVSEVERKLQFVKDERDLLKSREASVRQMIEESYERLKASLLKQRELLFQDLRDQTSEIGSSIDSNLQ